MQVIRSLSFVLISLLFFVGSASAQKGDVLAGKNQVALKGYDPVSYFTKHQAEVGSGRYTAQHKGYKFRFASAKHQKMFEQNPERFMPEYGGWCAFALAKKGKKVPADPETFKIVDGDLYLFFNGNMKGKRINAIVPWNKQGNDQAMIRKANNSWDDLS